MKRKPDGWMPTKPSPHQLFMLSIFSKGWKFKQTNNVHGSWNTYWSLRRKGLIEADSVLTDKGRAVLQYYASSLPTGSGRLAPAPRP
jgi:hypothetical protein